MGAGGGTISNEEDGQGGVVKTPHVWRVYTLGVILCAALTMCSRYFGDRGGLQFMASLTLAGIAYLLAIREFFATPQFSRRIVVIGLVLAAVWHIEFLRLPSGTDDDIHRYVWMATCRGSATTPTLSFPAILALKSCTPRKLAT